MRNEDALRIAGSWLDTLRELTATDEEDASAASWRERNVGILAAAFIATNIAMALWWTIAGDVTRPLIALAASATAAGGGLVLHRRVSSFALGNALACLAVCELFAWTASTDTGSGLLPVLLPVLPVLATVAAGIRAGLLWSALALVQLLVTRVAAGRDPQTMAPDLGVSSLDAAAFAVVVVATGVTIYELRNRALRLELIRHRDEMAAHNLALAESNAELDQFAYSASHDLKEPLRGISSYIGMLREECGESLGADGADMIARIDRLTQRMSSLLESLLRFSRVGRTGLEIEYLSMRELCREVVDSLDVLLCETNTRVRIAEDLPTVPCDRARMLEVLQNLITNAARFNDNDVRRIEIGCQRKPVPTHKSGPTATTVFFVRDNGIGIPPAELESVFLIFRRLHDRDAYGGGTGAGLTIVRRIIERHGGQVWAQPNADGEGTTIFFTIGTPEERESATSDDWEA
jgi:signal transduction histidine kinase